MRFMTFAGGKRRSQESGEMEYDNEKESLKQKLSENENRLLLLEAQITLIRHETVLKKDEVK